jgi:DNA-binding MarR family transcriptional regulator
MNESAVDEIAESIMLFFPLLKRLLRGDPGDTTLAPFRNQSYHVLRILQKRGPLAISTVGSRLAIAKQNMTGLIDRLEADGLVERRHDPSDRRIVNIAVTEKGGVFLSEATEGMKQIITRNLAGLSAANLDELHHAMTSIRRVFLELEKEGKDDTSD